MARTSGPRRSGTAPPAEPAPRAGASPVNAVSANPVASSIAALLLSPAPGGRSDTSANWKPVGCFSPKSAIFAHTPSW